MGINKWEIKGRKEKGKGGRKGMNKHWQHPLRISKHHYSKRTSKHHLDFITSISLWISLQEIWYRESITLCKMPVLTANKTALTFICYYFQQFLPHQLRNLCLRKLHSHCCVTYVSEEETWLCPNLGLQKWIW